MAGCPLQCYWCNVPFLVHLKEGTYDSKPTDFFVRHFARLQSSVDGIAFLGGEPLMQSNVLIQLCRELKSMGFSIRTETSGFYPSDLRELLSTVDYLSMDVKTTLDPDDYVKATALSGDKQILFSKILSSLAFLEAEKKAFREIRTTVVPGLNDSPEAIEKICSQVAFADLYALQQLKPGAKGDFVDPNYATESIPSKEKMYELAYAAKKTFKEVLIRFNDGSEEIV